MEQLMAIHFSKYRSAMKASQGPSYTNRSLILMVAIFILLPVRLLKAETVKQNVMFSGYPKMDFSLIVGGKITTIEGDLTIQHFDKQAISDVSLHLLKVLTKVTGTVTIKNLSVTDFYDSPVLEQIGGNLIMHDNPNLEVVAFLKNNVSVNGSIEGKNCPKLCQTYSYLVSVDEKYSNLFDEDCFTFSGDVDMLLKNNTIGDKTIIKGALSCNSATNPQFENFDGWELLISLKKVLSVDSLLFDNCPIASLSSTLPSLKKVKSTVQIINSAKLEDKKFSDWLYNIETIHSNMVLKNNKNVCLKYKHAEEWKIKDANIQDYTACDELIGDADLGNASTLVNGTTRVSGRILCVDVQGTEFSSEAKKFLADIESAEALEFTRCEPFVNFNKIFPNGLPKADSVMITECINFETDLNVLKIVEGNAGNISIIDCPKVCFTEMQLDRDFIGSKIKQKKFCGKTVNERKEWKSVEDLIVVRKFEILETCENFVDYRSCRDSR